MLFIRPGIANELDTYLQKQEKTVYLVTSFNDNNEWTRRVRSELGLHLRKSGYLVNMRNIYLDANSLMSKQARKKVVQSYLDGVNEIIDVFVAVDYGAVETMLSFTAEERAHIPLILVSEYDFTNSIDSSSLITGAVAEIPFEKTFNFARKTLPDADKVYIWGDKSSRGKYYMNEARRQLAKYENEIDIEYGVDALSSNQFLNKATELPANSFVIFSDWYEDDTHHYHNPEYFYPILAKSSTVPIFSVVDNYVRDGFVGGDVVSPKSYGVVAAHKVIDLLKGKSVASIPVEFIHSKQVFNQKVMNRWGISFGEIAPKARLINWEKSSLQEYRIQKRLIQTICVILSLICLIFAFLYWHRQRRLKASLLRENILRQTKEKLKFRSEILSNTMSLLQEGMVTVSADMLVLECNEVFCQLVELSRPEVIGQPITSVCEFADIDNMESFLADVSKGIISAKNINPMFLISCNGISHYVAGEVVAFSGSDSNHSGAILLIRDVLTEMRQKKMHTISLHGLKAYTWFCDMNTDELIFGEGFENLGISAHEVNTLSKYSSYIHPLDKERMKQFFEKRLKSENKEEFSVVYRVDFEGNGHYKWWECRGILEKSKIGKQSFSYLYGLHIDIDQEKNNEYQLVLDRQLFSLVGDAAKVGYAKYNLKTGKGFALPQWYKNLDLSAENRIDFDFRESFNYVASDQRYDLLKFYVSASCRKETVYSGEKKIITPEGNIKWLHGSMMVIENSEKELELIEITYDITQQKQFEKELIIAKNKAESANQLKSAFLANMSHEIRTPLNAIVGFSDLLISADCSPADREKYGKIIMSNNEILLKLINDILDLSKIEAGSVEFTNSEFDLTSFFKHLKLSNELLMPAGVEFRASCEKPHYPVKLDKDKICQIINNFLSNAIKFTNQGSITIGYQIMEHDLKLFVKDTGPGISPENCAKVFDRFEKLDSDSPGTGLGLSISKAIAESGGGRIHVESVYGEGATFSVYFPLECIGSGNVCEPDAGIIAEQKKTSSKNTFGSKILVAEDIDSNYMLVENVLTDYKLDRAHDGDEVIEMIQKENYDLILMDIKMPGLSGLEAAQIIREFNTRIPIVAVTAYAFETDRKEIMDAGCDMFVSKPFNKQELLSIVNEAITMERV
ncbi:MAG: ABC transporter substrate binding protein [Bacteroidales bacterium]